ncbi:MAG: tetratricopeptide repeat protein [Lewinellaceae bacterium]|nr:tetratricopeptide repeat protein [Lewinellaceae bacterium]
MNTQQLKLIFKGRMEFGSQRSYEMASRHWLSRMDTYFRSDVLFIHELVFVEEEFALVIPQVTIMSSDKSWRSTTAMLQEVAQFAITGNIGAWCVDNGQLLDSLMIEPISEKSAVTQYILGRTLLQEGEHFAEASIALSRAIQKYERHALAYERRGYVNYKLKNYNDALHDFDKSIGINPNHGDPYYGRAKVRMVKNDWESAAADFDRTIQLTIALQPIYWLARLKKGECLFHSKKFTEAIKEFRLYLRRPFQESDPNFQRRRKALFMLGKALLAIDQPKEALEVLDKALSIRAGADLAPESDGLVQRAIAKRLTGSTEYGPDLQAAADLGCSEAVRLLEEWR